MKPLHGNFLINEKAEEKLKKRNIDVIEFLEWLTIGIKHLRASSYQGLFVCMIPVPGDDIIILLCEKLCEQENKIQPDLTVMEKKVLKYLVKGLSNKEIASNLDISAGTVNAYLDKIYSKLGAANRLHAACIAVKNGIAVPSP